MFTGIVEEIGTVLEWRREATDTLRIGAEVVLEGTQCSCPRWPAWWFLLGWLECLRRGLGLA